jgi:hypothetical protein
MSAFPLQSTHFAHNEMLPSPNQLLSRLLQTTPEAAQHMERVILSPGTWPNLDPADIEDHVYFPESGLLGLFWSGAPLTMGMALLGCQACWWSDGFSPVQMQVLQPGHGQRIRWSLLQAQPQRYAPWLLQIATASQHLVQQLAQMALCTQNHTRLQRVASCLLVMLNQKPLGDGQMSVAELAHWLACPTSQIQAAAQTLQAQGALQIKQDAGAGTNLQQLQPRVLARLACSCHLRLAQGPGASGAAGSTTGFAQADFDQLRDINARDKDSATLMPSTPADKMPPA